MWNKLIKMMAICMVLVAFGCNAVQNSDRVLKSAKNTYKAAWNMSSAVWNDSTISQVDKDDYKAKVLPILQVTEASIIAGNVALQAYIKVADNGTSAEKDSAVDKVVSVVGTVVSNISKLVYAVNSAGKAVGVSLEMPEAIQDAIDNN